jgi:hypothetical protein
MTQTAYSVLGGQEIVIFLRVTKILHIKYPETSLLEGSLVIRYLDRFFRDLAETD